MRKSRVSVPVLATMACCVFLFSLGAGAQTNRKPGLWESTSTMTWQQSPMPSGMQMPPGASSAFGGGPHTTQVCVTQAMIDKYGAPIPQTRGNCTLSNVQMKSGGMSADWICTGQMAGKGSFETTWTDSDHAHTKVHFTGAMQMGPQSRPVEYSMESSSTYKGSDCGSVKPIQIPSN